MTLDFMLDETTLLWSSSLLLATGIFMHYFIRSQRRTRVDSNRKAEAVRLRIDRPIAQYPHVDPFVCSGCATCILACPEGDVLGVVRGTAVVINGLRCIGLGECERACPLGAITVGLGDLKKREDVPILDESLETNLDGVFIAGELGGMSLVSNAVRQGRTAAENIEASPTSEAEVLDLVVVGAGPAGLSAGLTAASRQLSYVILEREKDFGGTIFTYPRNKLVMTQPVDLGEWGSIDRPSYSKEELLEQFEQLSERAGLAIRFGAAVKGFSRVKGHYSVQSAAGEFKARNILLALGRRGNPRKLGVPGEDAPKVTYRLIDAKSYQDKDLLVVGGGDSAAEAAIALALDGRNRVALSYRREKLVRIKQKNQELVEGMIEKGWIRPLFPSQVREISERSVQLEVDEGEVIELPNDHVFVCIGGEPPFKLLKSAGIRFGGEDPVDDGSQPPVARQQARVAATKSNPA